jgi:ribokinase
VRGAENISMIVLQYEIGEATLHAAFQAAQQAGIPILFNYAPARSLTNAIVPGVNCGIVVNENEASALSSVQVVDRASAFAAAHKLRSDGYKFAIVTLGANGACLLSEDGEMHLPAVPVASVDSTAAGDCFCGALAAAVAEGASLPDAARFATAAAALCVQKAGAQPSIPTRHEIDRLMDELHWR